VDFAIEDLAKGDVAGFEPAVFIKSHFSFRDEVMISFEESRSLYRVSRVREGEGP
jgi:hypothetical protein